MKLLTSRAFPLNLKVLALIFVFFLLIFIPLFTDEATAQTSPVEIVPNNAQIAVEKLLNEIQLKYSQAVTDANTIINELPQQIASGSQEKAIGKNQDLLENLADSIDDLGEKVAKFNKKNLGYQASLTNDLQKNIQNLQISLENTAKKIDILADDTERAKEGASAFLRTRIDQEIENIKQALLQSDEAFKAFNPS